MSFDSILLNALFFAVSLEQITLMGRCVFHQYSMLLSWCEIIFDVISWMIGIYLDIGAFSQLIFILLFLTFKVLLELFPKVS